MPVSALDMPSSLTPQDLLEEVGRGLQVVEGLGCNH